MWYDICYSAAQICMKGYLFDIDYESVLAKTDTRRKDTKDKGAAMV